MGVPVARQNCMGSESVKGSELVPVFVKIPLDKLLLYSQAFGPCATECCEIRQVRKEATVSGYSGCRRTT